MNPSPFRYGLFWLSLAVVVAAAWLWNERAERRHEAALVRHEQATRQTVKLQTQHAAALLSRAFHADNYLTYSAVSQTTAQMGPARMASVARIVRAPRRLSIVYQSGDHAGLQSGYNEQWGWRQVSASQPMTPYVEMERGATDVAAKRFSLLMRNYEAKLEGTERVGGREAEVVELRPFQPAPGAQGPAKKLWIDAKTGLTLRLQSFNHQMMPVMDSILTEVNLAPHIASDTFVPPQRLREAARVRPWRTHDAGGDVIRIARLAKLYPPRPQNLPAGFEFDGVGAHRCTFCEKRKLPACYAALSRYSDGLNTLTIGALNPKCPQAAEPISDKINQTSKERNSGKAGACAFGAGTLVMRETPQGKLVAVSDLPAPVLRHVLESASIRLYNSS